MAFVFSLPPSATRRLACFLGVDAVGENLQPKVRPGLSILERRTAGRQNKCRREGRRKAKRKKEKGERDYGVRRKGEVISRGEEKAGDKILGGMKTETDIPSSASMQTLPTSPQYSPPIR
jgi:hypothetical protein